MRTFQRRLELCVETHRGSILHLLSSRRKTTKKTDKVDDDKMPHLLTNQENLILYQHNLETHHKWKKISESV